MKKCKDKTCRAEFEPIKSIQPYCFDCTIKRAKIHVKKENDRQWKERKKAMKEKVKKISDYRSEARYWFQRWIRLRDVGKKCISCNVLLTDIRTFDAGHYYPAFTYPNLLFNEYNVNGQCKMNCNNMLSGNLIEYRKGIIQRYGDEVLKELDSIAEDKSKRTLTKEYYIEIADIYKAKCKEIEKVQ